MNKWVVGGVLTFAFGVAGITQGYIELFPKPMMNMITNALSGKTRQEKIEALESSKSADVGASQPSRLSNWEDVQPKQP